MKKVCESLNFTGYHVLGSIGMKLIDIEDVCKCLDYERIFPAGEVKDCFDFVRRFKDLDIFLIKHGVAGENVALLYIEDMGNKECRFSFEALRVRYRLRQGVYSCSKEILNFILDNVDGLGYDSIRGYTPYMGIVRFASRFGFNMVSKSRQSLYNVYTGELMDVYEMLYK